MEQCCGSKHTTRGQSRPPIRLPACHERGCARVSTVTWYCADADHACAEQPFEPLSRGGDAKIVTKPRECDREHTFVLWCAESSVGVADGCDDLSQACPDL